MDHYIVKVNSGHGAQYAHIEVPAGQRVMLTQMITEIETGPHESADLAWAEWHKIHGNLSA